MCSHNDVQPDTGYSGRHHYSNVSPQRDRATFGVNSKYCQLQCRTIRQIAFDKACNKFVKLVYHTLGVRFCSAV